MDCETFRERLCIDPAELDTALGAHEAQCAACRAFAARIRRTEQLLQRALRFEPSAAGGSGARVSAATRRRLAWAAIAVAAIGGVSLWFAATAGRPTPTEHLAAAVLEHWGHEPNAWVVTDVDVDPLVLERVLAGNATIDLASLGRVSYAHTCRVAGKWMPHLVLQTEAGPVMLLLIPEQRVESPVPLRLPDDRLGGMLRGLGRGSIAVLGDDAQLAPVERRIDAAIDI